jgi:hypothetical protein
MAKNRNEQASRSTRDADKPAQSDRGVYQSGVVDKALVDRVRRISDPDPWRVGEDPPWSIVERYLTTGEYRELIEEHARNSRAFADVIEALRNDEEDHEESLDLEPIGLPDPHEPPRSRGHRPPLRVVR